MALLIHSTISRAIKLSCFFRGASDGLLCIIFSINRNTEKELRQRDPQLVLLLLVSPHALNVPCWSYILEIVFGRRGAGYAVVSLAHCGRLPIPVAGMNAMFEGSVEISAFVH